MEIVIDDYIVLGDTIDQEMKEKIRECIMATRMASGGTDNLLSPVPFSKPHRTVIVFLED